MIVLPAVIPENLEDLESHLLQVRRMAKWVQIDICDGRLTPSASWPFVEEYGEMEEILGQQRGLPFWEDFDFEIDLMVQKPADEYERWIDAGASRIIFHYKESLKDVLVDIMQKTKDRGVEVGLALHVGDAPTALAAFAELLDVVQVMGIKNIGLQGEPFNEDCLELIRDVRSQYPQFEVSVDGGVNTDTVEMLADADVHRLVIGSALYGQGDIREIYNYFTSF